MDASMADHQRIHPASTNTPSPPPHWPPPSTYSSKKTSCVCRCACYVTLAALAVAVLLGASAGALYLVFKPRNPSYTIDHLAVAAFSIDNNQTVVRTSLDVAVVATNPNKRVGIYYEAGSHLSTWYGNMNLSNGSFPAFYQGHDNVTVINVRLRGEARLESAAVEALREQQRSGVVPLAMTGDVPVRVRVGRLRLWRMVATGRCSLVVSSMSAGNTISVRSSSCDFKIKL